MLKRAGSDRVALVLIRVQEAVLGGPVDHLSQLPSQIHRILHTEAEALSTCWVVHVRRVVFGDPGVYVRISDQG